MNQGEATFSHSALLIGLAVVAVLCVAPWFSSGSHFRHLLIVAMFYAVIASNWDLSVGYAGIFNFAHVAFFALGAYTAGILTKSFGVNPWLTIPIGGLVAAVVSLIVCLPVLRVKGIYVCLVTFAFSQLCLHIVRSQREWTGGAMGLSLIPPLQIGGFSLADHGNLGYHYLALAVLAVSTIYLSRVVKSNFGKSIIALRDYEDYAISRGVPLARQRLLTFAASAIFTGAIGAIYALYLGVVSLELFGFGYLTILLSMIVLGGIATIFGPIIGAFILAFVAEFMMDLGPSRYLIIAIAIVLVLRFYPSGIFGALKQISRRITTTQG